jgi:hypothetical protein
LEVQSEKREDLILFSPFLAASFSRAWRGLTYLLDPDKPLVPKLWILFAAVVMMMISRLIFRRKK